MTAFWVLTAAVALALTAIASTHAVDHAARAAAGLAVPAFLVGFTVVAIGTDLPEIGNSIAASVTGHGDVNVGDSIGSAAAQGGLVLGLVPWLARRVRVARRGVAALGIATVAVLLLGAALVADGDLARPDGLLLVVAWVVAVRVVWRRAERPAQPGLPLPAHRPAAHVALAGLWLLGVAGGAVVVVVGVTRAAEGLSVPEYLVSFLGLAVGTSLPELSVAVAAARRGQGDLAIGNALGASLADASLSVGIGPVVAPTPVTASLAIAGGLGTAALLAWVTLLLLARGRLDRLVGTLMLAGWLALLPLLAGRT